MSGLTAPVLQGAALHYRGTAGVDFSRAFNILHIDGNFVARQKGCGLGRWTRRDIKIGQTIELKGQCLLFHCLPRHQ